LVKMFGEVKKSFNENSRMTYQNYNRSLIFDNKAEENTSTTRKLRMNAVDNRFEPKFVEISCNSRKHKEVWDPKADINQLKQNTTNSTFGHYRKEVIVDEKGVENPAQLDPWRRKLAELNPKLREDHINEVADLQGTDGFYARRSLITGDGTVASHKDAKVKELQSNIFNDLDKNEDPYPHQRKSGSVVVDKRSQKRAEEESKLQYNIGSKPRVERVHHNLKHLVNKAEPHADQLESVSDTYHHKKMKQVSLLSQLDSAPVKRTVVETEPNRAERSAKENNEKLL